MRRYYIKTYGCQMNVSDSGELAKVFEDHGYKPAKTVKDADIVLVNTCVVRQHAEDKASWYITSIKGLKKQNPNVIIGVCGCLVSEPGRDVKKIFPHVDLFIGPHEPKKLKEFLKLQNAKPKPQKAEPASLASQRSGPADGSKIKNSPAFVTIIYGCDNFCSYCIVPYVRGREHSRPMDQVLAEIKELFDAGVCDITLLGQNVNSYKYGLANLLREIGLKIPHNQDAKIHFLTCHPRDLSDKIIQTVHELPYVAKEFFLPLQSGDNEILKKMNRGYTVEYYIDRVKKIRSLMPNAGIISDILVGFPGETEEQFLNTLAAIEKINFNQVHMFAYSSRPNTAASKLPGHLPDEVRQQRLQKLIQANRKRIAAE